MTDLISIFAAVFVAELGDKTQVATLLFAAESERHPGLVFVAAAAALVCSTGLAVAVGAGAGRFLDFLPLKLIAGLGFIAIGGWLVTEHFRGA
ncbi:MAG: TMEM165/GDT1 family protein [Alphaproteobacteria bacterium]|jgi:putative Ca2+/H+ antiporter (TMEM165/GDT1 family)|nr:hypothetical protein [Rhodospirillaceae bacterium]MDP6407482.1 TMEM165/GDT1 family protein [Alphaproteobacteria bacterium]MDP6622018.1 TMEM165/GDT1 family protein [Alphaproteobacteria bacterium]|tara:strand:+ start:1255 stop:1533 length:279 start_codon:yes stop_codon:yes gene_type:complete